MRGDSYVLPREPSDSDRLDLMQHIYRATAGSEYDAPVADPARVLDAGCGTGLWAHTVAERFPGARVVGLDIAPTSRPGPANYDRVRANLLVSLPFADGAFDFVHQRCLTSGIPADTWAAVIRRLVGATRRGGWLELCEAAQMPSPAGPAATRVMHLWLELARPLGLDVDGDVPVHLGHHLLDAGLADVHTRRVEAPIGEWAGQYGYWLVLVYRIALTNLTPWIVRRFGLVEDDWREMVAAMLREFEELRPTVAVHIAYGRRP